LHVVVDDEVVKPLCLSYTGNYEPTELDESPEQVAFSEGTKSFVNNNSAVDINFFD